MSLVVIGNVCMQLIISFMAIPPRSYNSDLVEIGAVYIIISANNMVELGGIN